MTIDTDPARRLLLVEDNEDTRFLLTALLEDTYDVTTAGDGEAALAATAEMTFDLVLMDINLGSRTSGVDVLGALRHSPAHADVPVIALTAYAMPGDRQRFLAMGFTAYVAKPFSADELLDVLAAQHRRLAA